jgi:hypothetical protein
MFFSRRVACIVRWIPQSLQLQAQVTSASLGGRHKWGECAKPVRVDQCVSAVSAVDVPVFVCLRRSCSHVTEVAGPKACETRFEGCHAKWRGLCGRNPAITVAGYFLRSQQIVKYYSSYPRFMEPDGSLLYSPALATCSSRQADESSTRLPV